MPSADVEWINIGRHVPFRFLDFLRFFLCFSGSLPAQLSSDTSGQLTELDKNILEKLKFLKV